MTTINIFEQASRQALRFDSSKGQLTTEQLWGLPLTAKDLFSLDNVAKVVNFELKAQTEESFVATSTNPQKATLELKLEIVKHIIGVKLAENAAKADAVSRKAQKELLLGVIERKQQAELENLPVAELMKKVDALG